MDRGRAAATKARGLLASEQFGAILDAPQGLHGKKKHPGFWRVQAAGQSVECRTGHHH